jgi:uncharacterized protein (TIGR03000 family)
MLRRWIPSLATFALVVSVLAVFAESAEAQLFRGRRTNRGRNYMPSGYYSQPYYRPAYYGQPYYSQPMQGQPMQGELQGQMPTDPGYPGAPGQRRAYYGANISAPVQLSVRVPPNAELLVDGQKTRSMGPMRLLTSPPLEPGQQYVYQLEAKWMESGQEVTRTRTVEVRPGQVVTVDFLSRSPDDRTPPDGRPIPDGQTRPDSKTIP